MFDCIYEKERINIILTMNIQLSRPEQGSNLFIYLFFFFLFFFFIFFDSLLKLASSIIFYLLNLSANLHFHTYKHC